MKTIINECETCNKVLDTYDEWKECWDKNHDLHTHGCMVIPIKDLDIKI